MPEESRSRPSPLYLAIGKNICSFRKELALSQAELATKVGMGQALVAAIEIGTRRISIEDLLKVCEVLRVSISDLLPAQEEPRKPGPKPKLTLAYEKLLVLPEKEQNAIMVMIDSMTVANSKE